MQINDVILAKIVLKTWKDFGGPYLNKKKLQKILHPALLYFSSHT